MLLSEPRRTDYDINFSLFGFPVRVHPLFFVLPILLGRGMATGFDNPGVGYLIVVALFFVSVLIHELGHSLAFQLFKQPSRIVLYWMGGLAIPDTGAWSQRSASLTQNQRMFISFAGPLAGLLLAGVFVLIGLAMGGKIFLGWIFIPIPLIDFRETIWADNQSIRALFFGGILLNIFLNLFNLLPVYPLDGGQIAGQFMSKMDPRDGFRNSLILSMAVAGMIAVFALLKSEPFLALFFGYIAYTNFQRIQPTGPSW